MARMVVIYKTPADSAVFDKHYFDVHIPLAKGLPGLKRYEVSKGPIVALAGATDTYLIGTLHFDSLGQQSRKPLQASAGVLVRRIAEYWRLMTKMCKCSSLKIKVPTLQANV